MESLDALPRSPPGQCSLPEGSRRPRSASMDGRPWSPGNRQSPSSTPRFGKDVSVWPPSPSSSRALTSPLRTFFLDQPILVTNQSAPPLAQTVQRPCRPPARSLPTPGPPVTHSNPPLCIECTHGTARPAHICWQERARHEGACSQHTTRSNYL